jgi:hypothetical protein
MSRITRAAKLRSCTLRLPGCRNETESVVFAHAPSASSGMGFKSPDWWGCFACYRCHTEADRYRSVMDNPYSGDWLRAIHETQKILFDEGYLLIP